MHAVHTCPSQIIRREEATATRIRIQEVRTIKQRPALGRQWMADGLRNDNVGCLVRDTIAEADSTLALSFSTFVPSQRAPNTWFTFLRDGNTVTALATCTAVAPNRSAMRRMRDRLCTAVVPETPSDDRENDPFFVLINRDHSTQSVSCNAPNEAALDGVLQRLQQIHRQSRPSPKWVAWIPGYRVTFQSMNHATTTTLATLHPVGRATVPVLAQLTPAQVRIVRYAANGSTVPEIARSLNRSIETVRTHLRAAYRSLQVCSRVELLPSSEEFAEWGAL